jgi:hypothetical protein
MPFFFKETEKNQRCCGCSNTRPAGRGAPSENPQIVKIILINLD